MNHHRLGALVFALIAILPFEAHANGDKSAPVDSWTAPVDSWTGSDKKVHFGVSFILGIAAGSVEESKPKAIAYAMVPGILKEAFDPRWSNKDLVWDFIGAAAGVYSVHYMIKYDKTTKTTVVGYQTQF